MIRPMLGVNADLNKLIFPLFVSPKLDGVRAIVYNGVVQSRNGKIIPNRYVQYLFGNYHGLDGELIVGSMTNANVFRTTTSGVMTLTGSPDVYYCIFDFWDDKQSYISRLQKLQDYTLKERIVLVPQTRIHDLDELLQLEEHYLQQGFEGIMLRQPNSVYKFGRSTIKEGALLKLKRFTDSEAIICNYEPLYRNHNQPTINELGYTERSSHQDNKVASNLLGALYVKDINTGVEFKIGTGFDEATRSTMWLKRTKLIGQIVKYKYFTVGVKDKPRFPVFLGIRDKNDI